MPDEKKKETKLTKPPKPAEPGGGTSDTATLKARLETIGSVLGYQAHQQRFTDDSWSILLKFLRTDFGDASAGTRLIQGAMRPQISQLESEITKLKSEISQKAQALSEQSVDAKQKGEQIHDLEDRLQTLNEKQRLSHLLTRVGNPAQQKLLDSPEFRAQFDRDTPCLAYVLSIDIRRSTELMLKAREPKLFAEFVMSLTRQLRDVVLENYGIFDKFTGDGILAFFPEFYSGSDAGYFALRVAAACHEAFASHYDKHKHCFVSILKDTGLGIGVDYGQVQIVQLGGDFTVVGTPVVYACRMGGAEARHTYLNQPAFEQLFERYSSVCDFDSCEIDIKHEGLTLAYSAELNGKTYSAKLPDWCISNDTDNQPPKK
jgi:adenylate cyclase